MPTKYKQCKKVTQKTVITKYNGTLLPHTSLILTDWFNMVKLIFMYIQIVLRIYIAAYLKHLYKNLMLTSGSVG